MQRDPEASKSKIKKESLHAEQVTKSLAKELADQEENNSFVLKRLKDEKDKWVGQADSKSDMITNFLQVCIFPRCFFSAPGRWGVAEVACGTRCRPLFPELMRAPMSPSLLQTPCTAPSLPSF